MRIVSLHFGPDVRTCLGVAICDVSGRPVFYIKLGASRQVPCPRTQQAKLPTSSSQPPLNTERQGGKLWIPFVKVFWYDSTRKLSPRSTDYKADALTTWPCCCCLPDPFRGMGAWRKTMEPQNPGNSPGSGPEVAERQRVAKE